MHMNVCMKLCIVKQGNPIASQLVKGNPQGLRYFTYWSEHINHSGEPLLEETVRTLQLQYTFGVYSKFNSVGIDFSFYYLVQRLGQRNHLMTVAYLYM